MHITIPQPPSRRDNPFATCWTRPGALAFRFAEDQNAEQLVAALAAQNWWGAIVGPHGSGKSTMLEALKPALAAAGRHVRAISLHDGQRRLPRSLWEASRTPIELSTNQATSASERPPTDPTTEPRNQLEAVSKLLQKGDRHILFRRLRKMSQSPAVLKRLLVIIDGYEQLGWLERLRLARHCRRANVGLLVTSHARTHIPTLIRLVPDCRLVAQLVADLDAEVSTTITFDDVVASHACHGSNVREIFFDLYDRHERRRHSPRTRRAATA